MRAAAIQAFEYTYELAYKTLKRFLTDTAPDPSVIASLDFNGVVRLGFARGLLAEEVAGWRQFREHRGVSGHTNDASEVQSVLSNLPGFLAEARHLHACLRAQKGVA